MVVRHILLKVRRLSRICTERHKDWVKKKQKKEDKNMNNTQKKNKDRETHSTLDVRAFYDLYREH